MPPRSLRRRGGSQRWLVVPFALAILVLLVDASMHARSPKLATTVSTQAWVDKILPVDLYVPGCPPRPDAFLEGVTLLSKLVGTERRPLSWVVGPQGVERAPVTSRRDMKRSERQKATRLRPPNEI